MEGNHLAKNSPQDIKNREYFSDNLNRIMKEKGVRQIDLHNNTDIPKSTITGYVKGKSLPTPGNLKKIADFLNVKKSDLDLRFNLREENPQIKLIDSWLNGLMELSNIESSVTENGDASSKTVGEMLDYYSKVSIIGLEFIRAFENGETKIEAAKRLSKKYTKKDIVVALRLLKNMALHHSSDKVD